VPTDSLERAALEVLRLNDLGDWTKPAPRLYPHQWSWDSAFIAIGLARIDVERALRELETLFAAQWADGRVPHIVFNQQSGGYFPGPEWWASAATSNLAPNTPATSGLIQPPVHALALQHILAHAPAELTPRIAALYQKVVAWHRYLSTARDPSGSGLLTIYHPWESGTDNSPRWDAALARIQVGTLPQYERHDLKHVQDAAQRPTNAEYDRYLWLVELLKAAGYDDATVQRTYPFQIQDALMSAIFAAANQVLAQVGKSLGRPAAESDALLDWSRRSSQAVAAAWDSELDLALDQDVHAGPIRVQTCAGLAPVLVPHLDVGLRDSVIRRLFGPGFAGADGLAYPVVPSTAPGSTGFNPRSYWRGPTWPVFNWLMGWGLKRQGLEREAAALRDATLRLLEHPGARFAEYFEPFTAEPLGSLDQSWTAAVALAYSPGPRIVT
jgi:glucosylglycerate hydrolase